MQMERCCRCRVLGQELFTLKMNCGVDIAGLKVPFVPEVRHLIRPKIPIPNILNYATVGKYRVDLGPVHALPFDGIIPEIFYTLRVCQKCRTSWMKNIENWVNTQDAPVVETQAPLTIVGPWKGKE